MNVIFTVLLFYRLPIKYKIRESFSVKLIHLNFIVPNTILCYMYNVHSRSYHSVTDFDQMIYTIQIENSKLPPNCTVFHKYYPAFVLQSCFCFEKLCRVSYLVKNLYLYFVWYRDHLVMKILAKLEQLHFGLTGPNVIESAQCRN